MPETPPTPGPSRPASSGTAVTDAGPAATDAGSAGAGRAAAEAGDVARDAGASDPERSPESATAHADEFGELPPTAPPRWRQVRYLRGALPAALGTGLVAALVVPLDRPGLGWLLLGLATVVAVAVVRRGADPARDTARLMWTAATLALLAVGAIRAAGWLFVLCVLAAAVTGSLAVLGRHSAGGMFRDALAVPLASFGALAWLATAQEARWRGGAGAAPRRLVMSALVTAALLAVFVPLLASADATFGAFVDVLVPRADSDAVGTWALAFAPAAAGTAAALYLLAALPEAARRKRVPRTLARPEWALPVGALTLVFAVFVGAQLVALFGGDDYVQRTAGLTYAEYARSGFWQLSAVTVLTLAVILPVLHRAARATAADRRWLRLLLCALSGLTLVMIASALGRMWTYQQAYGWTVLRLLVGSCELWLGVVYLLVIAAVLRLAPARLPRAALGTAVAALLALAVLNPEGFVADRNIDRWQRGDHLDLGYLSGLSSDAGPALDRLPPALSESLRTHPAGDPWTAWNLSRHTAR